MRKYVSMLLVLGIVLAGAFAVAGDKAQEAKAMAEKAVAMAKEKGLKPTLKVISDRQGPFVKGPMYVVAGDFSKTTMLAHPYATAMMIGADMSNFKDPKGNQVFIMFGKVAKGPGSGWVDYQWRNRNTGKISAKRAYILRVPGTTAYMACAYYPE